MAVWRADLRAVPRATPSSRLRILAGDFNATLDHAELRRLIDSGYVDAAAEVGAGLRATWPNARRLPPPVTIDHVLADARAGVQEFSVHPIPGTDHRAVFAELVLPRVTRSPSPSRARRLPTFFEPSATPLGADPGRSRRARSR